jgi:lysozyme
MKMSDEGLRFLANEEGTVLHVYKDVVGIPTIGVGHVVRAGESFPNGITLEQAMKLLANDVMVAENAIKTHVKVELNQNQFDALTSFIFNCGGGAFASSTMLKLLNQSDYVGCADQLLRWVHAGKDVNQGLVNRRKRERALFLKPVEAPKVQETVVSNDVVEPETVSDAHEPPPELPEEKTLVEPPQQTQVFEAAPVAPAKNPSNFLGFFLWLLQTIFSIFMKKKN